VPSGGSAGAERPCANSATCENAGSFRVRIVHLHGWRASAAWGDARLGIAVEIPCHDLPADPADQFRCRAVPVASTSYRAASLLVRRSARWMVQQRPGTTNPIERVLGAGGLDDPVARRAGLEVRTLWALSWAAPFVVSLRQGAGVPCGQSAAEGDQVLKLEGDKRGALAMEYSAAGKEWWWRRRWFRAGRSSCEDDFVVVRRGRGGWG
jgi:hypothetical protein